MRTTSGRGLGRRLRKRITGRRLILAGVMGAIAVFFLMPLALGQTCASGAVRWVGGSGNWNVAANWQDAQGINRIPGPADDVCIEVAAGVTVTLNTPQSVRSFVVKGGLTIAADLTFTSPPSSPAPIPGRRVVWVVW